MRKPSEYPESCKGKHDYELQNNLKDLFKDNGLNPIIGVERKRGRIKVQCAEGDYLLTARLVRQLHPDFVTRVFEKGFVEFSDTI